MRRIIVLFSILALAAVLAAAGYFGLHRASLAGIENERLSRLGDQWILDFDIVNPEKTDQVYYIQVIQGESVRAPIRVVAAAGKVFKFSAHIYPDKVGGDEVTMKAWQDSPDGPPIRTSTYYLR